MDEILSYKSMSKNLNDLCFTDYYYRLMLIARSLFKWNNLPEGMDEKWIERFLYTDGSCIFYHDNKLGYMVAHYANDGGINAYDEPTQVEPVAPNYTYSGKTLVNGDNVVIIRNNDIMRCTATTIKLFAYDLANIKRTIDVNISAQKTPVIVRCSDKQRMSLKNAINQRNDNEPVIFADKSLDLTQIEVLDLKPPKSFTDLQLQKHAIYNECMTFLGVNNANQDKKERLVESEVNANNDQVKACEDVMLKAREYACEEINRIFGLNISVERRSREELPDLFVDNYNEEEM